MKEKMYKSYLKELFGPNPTQLYVKHYNIYSTKINHSLHKCERETFGGSPSKDQNHYCYFRAIAKHIPSLVSALKYASEHQCKGNSSCQQKLLAMARSAEGELPKAKKLRDDFKKKS